MTTLTTTWAADSLQRIIETAMVANESPSVDGSNAQAAKHAEALGLEVQASRYKKAGSIYEAFASSRLEGEELGVWERFCPTHYVVGSAEFKSYGFDTIPIEVLNYWTGLREKYAFDSFEIWTTERTRNFDPLLIGVYEGARYLLARWGKEAANLISFAEVRQHVMKSLHQNFDITALPEKIAKTVSWMHEKAPLEPIARYVGWNDGRFFYKKHCGQRLMTFKFGNGDIVTGVCSGCGGVSKIGEISYDYD